MEVVLKKDGNINCFSWPIFLFLLLVLNACGEVNRQDYERTVRKSIRLISALKNPAKLEKTVAKLGRKELKKFGRQLKGTFKPNDLALLDIKQIKRDEFSIIGYDPLWLSHKNASPDSIYFYNLLSAMIFGQYDVNFLSGKPKGIDRINYTSIQRAVEDKLSTESINLEQYNNKVQNSEPLKIYIAFHCPVEESYAGYKCFLENEEKAKAFGDSIKKVLRSVLQLPNIQNNADLGLESYEIGLFLDFTEALNHDSRYYGLFAGFISDYLLSMGELETDSDLRDINYLISLPNEINPSVQKLLTLAEEHPSVCFTVKAFQHQDMPGPIAPINISTGIGSSLSQNLNWYVESLSSLSLEQEASKYLIPEFPYFGTCWYKENAKWSLSPVRPFISYAQLMSKIDSAGGEIGPVGNGLLNGVYVDLGTDQRYYFDNAASLKEKYRWIKENNLGGVLIYGLGYGAYDRMLWQSIADENGFGVSKMSNLTFVGTAYLLLFILAALLVGIVKKWKVRNLIARSPSLQKLYLLTVFILLLGPTLIWQENIPAQLKTILILGFLLTIALRIPWLRPALRPVLNPIMRPFKRIIKI